MDLRLSIYKWLASLHKKSFSFGINQGLDFNEISIWEWFGT